MKGFSNTFTLSPKKRALLDVLLQEAGVNRSATPAIPRRKNAADSPLSFAQERLWFLSRLEPDNPAYNMPGGIRITGPLDVAALQESLNEIVRRHDVLRTTFAMADRQPVQVIAAPARMAVPMIDLRQLPGTEQEAEVRRLAGREAQMPFDLTHGPLFRAMVLQLGQQEHVVLLTMHHITSDGWSVGVLIHELGALYQAFSAGRPSLLPELPIQYADFAAWQRQWLQGEVLHGQLAYWKQQLAEAPEVLDLPCDRPRPTIQTFRGATQTLRLEPALTEALEALGQRHGATLFMTLLAAFEVLLYRYTGQEDLVVGTPIANRTRQETEGLIGFFVNTLALRADLSANPGFTQFLARVRATCLEAYAHQDLPFEKLVEELRPERDLSREPLFQVMFAVQNGTRPAPMLPALTLEPLPVETGTAKFDLTLLTEHTGDSLLATLEYNCDLFAAATIARLLRHWQNLLVGIVADPSCRLADLPLLDEPERRQLLVEWNATEAEYPGDRCIHQLFEEQAKRTPDAIAVICAGRHLTYRELNQRANQLAHHLQTLGVGPDVLVGICMQRSLEMVIGLLGILKAGAAYVPLDPTYPKERLAFMLHDAKLPVLLSQQRFVERLPEHLARLVCLDRDAEEISQQSAADPCNGVQASNLAYVIYTSGSTGQPKGVEIQHASLVNLVVWHQRHYQVTPADRATQVASPAFDASVWEVWPYLSAGASLAIPDEQTSSSPARLLDWLASQAVTISFLPTPFAEAILQEPWPARLGLRALLTGGG